MTKKIGIFVDTEKIAGGAYQELLSFIKNIEKYNKVYKLNFIIICNSMKLDLENNSAELKIIYFKMNLFNRYIHYLFNFHHFFRRIRKFSFFKNSFESFLAKENIDYVIFTSHSQYSLYLEKTNFSMIIPDVAHRENVEFPELANTPEFVWKDEIFSKSLIRASLIITNSDIVKKRISFFYNILEERIKVINQQPAESVKNFKFKKGDEEVLLYKKKNNLPDVYIFYPAMYLPHKNHKYIIDAIVQLNNDHKIDISSVFCGSDKGYLQNLIKYAKQKKIENKIKFLNFVKDEELPYLYINSVALAMPSLIGPTNIPPWEAFTLNVPVLYSDFGNIRTVLKDAVYYIDAFKTKTMIEGIKKILNDIKFSDDLIYKGKNLLNSINEKEEFDRIFKSILHNREIRERWIFN